MVQRRNGACLQTLPLREKTNKIYRHLDCIINFGHVSLWRKKERKLSTIACPNACAYAPLCTYSLIFFSYPEPHFLRHYLRSYCQLFLCRLTLVRSLTLLFDVWKKSSGIRQDRKVILPELLVINLPCQPPPAPKATPQTKEEAPRKEHGGSHALQRIFVLTSFVLQKSQSYVIVIETISIFLVIPSMNTDDDKRNTTQLAPVLVQSFSSSVDAHALYGVGCVSCIIPRYHLLFFVNVT